jgi:sensor histidine kinase YesM
MLDGFNNAFANLRYFVLYSSVFFFANALYYKFIGKVLDWNKKPERTLIISILGSIPVNALIYLALNFFIKVAIYKLPANKFLQNEWIPEYISVVMFSLVISLIIIISYFFKSIREEKLKAEQLKTKAEQAKLESLKSQMDPHFLFNSLNVLISLIDENTKKAEEFAIQLADIYKYVLEQKNNELVSVQEELDFAAKYLSLQKMRYEDDLIIELPNDNIFGKIPPLSLQLLLENAIKHNAITSEIPLQISIELVGHNLLITNNKTIKSVKENTHKIGLQILKERYLLLNKDINIKDGKDFVVTLPIL